MENLRFTTEELTFLKKAVPFLPENYLTYLKTFKLDPRNQVQFTFDETQDLKVLVSGKWVETILYEIPILALISEAYFKFVDTDWNYDNQLTKAAEKAKTLINNGCKFSEFGTRRRRSFETQDLVVEGILKGASEINRSESITGTSNVLLAMKYNLKPIGTVAHEWMMGIAAYTQDYKNANKIAMETWLKTFGDKAAGFALTDTFGSPNFLEHFKPPFTDAYTGVRQDSGDPVEYTKLVSQHYADLGYKPNTKMIIYSDSLNIDKCIKYKNAAEEYGLIPTFGVGTFLTNDFVNSKGEKSSPMNIVIKIASVNGKPAIKLSDDLGKNTGDSQTVLAVKKELGYVEKEWADEGNRW